MTSSFECNTSYVEKQDLMLMLLSLTTILTLSASSEFGVTSTKSTDLAGFFPFLNQMVLLHLVPGSAHPVPGVPVQRPLPSLLLLHQVVKPPQAGLDHLQPERLRAAAVPHHLREDGEVGCFLLPWEVQAAIEQSSLHLLR